MRTLKSTSALALLLTTALALSLGGCIEQERIELEEAQSGGEDSQDQKVELQGADTEELGQFFTWLEHKNPELKRKLNLSLRSEQARLWNFEQFQKQAIGDQPVRNLWDQYRDWNRRSSCDSCGDDEFCKTLIPEQCGRIDLGTARCVERPDVCVSVVEPVCGCDNNTYANECEANRAGFSIIARTDCVSFARGLRPPD